MSTQSNLSEVTLSTSLEQWVLRIAGIFILLSVLLAHYVHPGFLWFTLFVGANLFQTSFTGFCPLAMILQKMGAKPGQVFCKHAE